MTREEAIERYEGIRYTVACFTGSKKDCDAVDMAFSALRPVSREQVEKLRGEWEICEHALLTTAKCPKCGIDFQEYYGNFPFCPRCGSPMTDKAVDILLRRLEAMYDDTGD